MKKWGGMLERKTAIFAYGLFKRVCFGKPKDGQALCV
jgi:hypothetical protein